jgi:predicted ester cyclase
MTRDEIAAFFARRANAWARHDVAALVSDFADDCVVEGATAGILRGRSAVEAVYRHWFSAFPDIVFEPHDPVSMESRAAQVITIYGTDTAGFLGQAPTHKPFRFDCVITNEFLDGRVLREQGVYDLHGVLMQLATDPTLGQTPAEKYQTTLDRRRMAAELRMAADIQRLLLPNGQHRGDGFEVAATSIPCRAIGGDFFDYLDLPDGSFGFALGDVAGKGPPAALLAAELQGVLAAYSKTATSVSETIRCVNPSDATLRSRCRACRPPIGSSPTATDARRRGRTPSGRRAHATPANTCWVVPWVPSSLNGPSDKPATIHHETSAIAAA